MALDFVTGVGIPFDSNGVKVLQDLIGASDAFTQRLTRQTAGLEEATAAMAAYNREARLAAMVGDVRPSAPRVPSGAGRSAVVEREALNTRRAEAAVGGAIVANERGALERGGAGVGGALLGGPAKVATEGLFKAIKVASESAAGFAGDALYEAGKFQAALLAIKNVTGANAAQMEKARQLMFDVGDANAMTPTEAADMFKQISRTSQGAMSFDAMLGLLPTMGKMQKVLGEVRGFTPEQTTDNVMSVIHLLRAYDPKIQPKAMDKILRMSELMPDNLASAKKQLAFMLPTLKNLHVSDEDALSMMVAVSRFGMGTGKGGTTVQNLLADALGPLQQTQHAQKGKASRLRAMGLIDDHGNSKYFTDKGGDVFGFLQQLHSYSDKVGSTKATQTFESVFGKVGSRFADFTTDQTMIDQLKNIVAAMKEQKSLALKPQSDTIDQLFGFQFKRSWKDFQALATEVGSYAIPGLTIGLRDAGNAMHNVQEYLHAHPEIEKNAIKEFKSDVAAVETFFKNHSHDFKALGGDLLAAVGVAKKLGGVIGLLSGDFLSLYGSIHKIIDIFHLPDFVKGMNKGNDGTVRKALGRGNVGQPMAGQIPLLLDVGSHIGLGDNHSSSVNWKGAPGWGPPVESDQQKTREVHNTNVSVAITVNTGGHPMDEHHLKKMADRVQHAVERGMQQKETMARANVRHTASVFGSLAMHPGIPRPQTA